MSDFLIFFMWPALLFCATAGAYYVGVDNGKRRGYQSGWIAGDRSSSSTFNYIVNERDELLDRIKNCPIECVMTTGDATQIKKRGRKSSK